MLALRCAAVMAAITMWPFIFVASVSIATRQKRQLENTYQGLGANVEILPIGDASGVSSSYSIVETSKIPRQEYNTFRLVGGSRSTQRDSKPEHTEYRTYNKHPSWEGRLGDPQIASFKDIRLEEPKQKPFRESRLEEPKPKPFRESRLEEPKQNPYRESRLEEPKQNPYRESRLEEPKQNPYRESRSEETKQKPFRFPEEHRPTGRSSGETVNRDEKFDEILNQDHKRSEITPSNRRRYKPTKSKQNEEEETFGETKPAPRNIKEIVEERPAESKISSDLNNEGSRYIGSGGYGGGNEFDKEKHFDKEQGQKYLEGHKSEEGEKAEKAYKKEDAYDKGEKEDFGSDEKHSHLHEKAGEKKGHVDQAQHFGEAYHGNHGEKGISVVKKGGHKKGKKTSGFHKVHHKDEYKKDEVFYDESHDGDEHEEHKHEHEKHAKEKGGNEKKGHSDTGFHENFGNKKAESDYGKKYEQAKGHKSEAGEHAHHGQHSEFAKKGAVKEGEKYGHSDAGGGGYFEKGGYF